MRRYLRLYTAFWRNCFRQALEFRVNFWSNVFTNLGWVLSLVIFMKVIFMNTKAVAGWSEAEMFVLVGTYSTLRGIADTLFYRNLSDLPTQIRTGMMDFILLRPVNSQFYMSLRYVALDNIGQFAGAVLLLGYGLSSDNGSGDGVVPVSLSLRHCDFLFDQPHYDDIVVLADSIG
jgi:ABC-2 type transport system permease protein